jgi:thiamine biosynthesis lipoprotein
MRHVFETMGTVASIDVPEKHAGTMAALESIFRTVDGRYSLYRADSELSRIADGRLTLLTASQTLRDSYARSLEWRHATGGLFTPHRPDGVLDLNGIVKAEAIAEAGALLDSDGCNRWTIDVGGDILVRHYPVRQHPADQPWLLGISDPADAAGLLCSIAMRGARRAVATSGSAQRGDHIWLGGELRPAEYLQVTVVADDIITADVLATAIVAGGRDALGDFAGRWPIDVLTVDREGQLEATPGFREALAA